MTNQLAAAEPTGHEMHDDVSQGRFDVTLGTALRYHFLNPRRAVWCVNSLELGISSPRRSTHKRKMGDPDAVGAAFITYYYQLFEANRQSLAPLYQDASMLTFEGQKFQGAQAIIGKLSALPFGVCKVAIASKDFQPSVSGGIMVFVTGTITIEGEQHPLKFSQVFHLMPFNNSFVVTNDMFRLNYA